MIHPKAILTIAAIAAFPAFVIFSKDAFSNHKNGAFLDIESKANGFWEQSSSSWTLNKNSVSKSLTLGTNVFYDIQYALDVGKSPSAQPESKGAQGEVCVKNSGGQTTKNLKIENQIQYKTRGSYKDLPGANQTTTGSEIEAGKKSCIPFKIAFSAPQDATQFRVKSNATISNFFNRHDQEKTTSDTTGFNFPNTPTAVQDSATITDSIQCPQGFTCVSSDTGPWNTSTSTTINYSVLITNVSASCSPTSLKNTANLTSSANQNSTSSTNEIPINNGGC